MSEHKTSALYGFIDLLERGERVSPEAIEEIRKVLRLLQAEGWSGFIPADKALEGLIKEDAQA